MLLFLARFIIYPIPESPKFLIANGRDEEALRVLNFIAKENGKVCNLTLKQLKEAGYGNSSIQSLNETINTKVEEKSTFKGLEDEEKKDHFETNANVNSTQVEVFDSNEATSKALGSNFISRDTWSQLKKSSRHLDAKHFKSLFCSKKMALNTCLIMLCWSLIGLAYPLFNSFISIYIAETGGNVGDDVSQSEQYKQLVIIAVCGIPGR